MARDFVKDLSTVKQFNSELSKSKDTLDSLEGVGKDLGISLLKVADATNQSRKYSKENLDFAKQQSTAGKNILNVLNQQNLLQHIFASILGVSIPSIPLSNINPFIGFPFSFDFH